MVALAEMVFDAGDKDRIDVRAVVLDRIPDHRTHKVVSFPVAVAGHHRLSSFRPSVDSRNDQTSTPLREDDGVVVVSTGSLEVYDDQVDRGREMWRVFRRLDGGVRVNMDLVGGS